MYCSKTCFVKIPKCALKKFNHNTSMQTLMEELPSSFLHVVLKLTRCRDVLYLNRSVDVVRIKQFVPNKPYRMYLSSIFFNLLSAPVELNAWKDRWRRRTPQRPPQPNNLILNILRRIISGTTVASVCSAVKSTPKHMIFHSLKRFKRNSTFQWRPCSTSFPTKGFARVCRILFYFWVFYSCTVRSGVPSNVSVRTMSSMPSDSNRRWHLNYLHTMLFQRDV